MLEKYTSNKHDIEKHICVRIIVLLYETFFFISHQSAFFSNKL